MEDDDQMPSYFTSLAVQGAPSSVAEYSNVYKLQENASTRFANDRSSNDTQFLPIPLSISWIRTLPELCG